MYNSGSRVHGCYGYISHAVCVVTRINIWGLARVRGTQFAIVHRELAACKCDFDFPWSVFLGWNIYNSIAYRQNTQ